MTKQGVPSMLALALLLVALAAFPTGVHSIGVCNGVIGNNLPTPSDVVKLYRSKGINGMRIYAPESNVLKALSGTNIGLVMDVGNGELPGLASDPSAAAAWVKANVQPYPGVSFRYIAVGNEVMDSAGQKTILPAMKNMQGALAAAGLSGRIKVSTSVRFDVVTDTFPPSNGVFADFDYMGPIVNFLASTGAPLLANVYPYFAYKAGRPAEHPAQLRHLRTGHHRDRRRQRPHLHEPLRRHGRLHLRRAGGRRHAGG